MFINDLTTELYMDSLRVNGEYIYLHGACLTFIKIIENYFDIEGIYIRNDNDHCAFKYNNELYDASGLILDPEDYKIANQEDIIYMSEKFGGHLSDRHIYDTVIEEMNKIENIPCLDNTKNKKPKCKYLSKLNV